MRSGTGVRAGLYSVLSAVLLTLAAAFGSTGAASAAAPKGPIEIGVPLPMTGVLAESGANLLDGIKYATYQVNKAGGIDGRKIELLIRDTQGDPTVAAQVATALITQSHVTAFVGGYGSTPDYAMFSAIEQYNPLFMSVDTSSPQAEQLVSHANWFFHTYIWDPYREEALVSFLNTLRPKPKTVVVAHESGQYGTQGAQQVIPMLRKAGYQVLANLSFTAGSPDFTPTLQQVKALHPDVFYDIGYPSDDLLIAKQAAQQDIGAKLMVHVWAGESQSQFGKYAAGLVSIDVWNPAMKVPGMQAWIKGYKAYIHQAPNGGAVQGYAGAITLYDAMKMTRSLNEAKLISALSRNSFWTPFGILKYRAAPGGGMHQLLLPQNQVIYQYRGNTSVVVWPAKVANGKAQYPFNYYGK